MSELEFQEWLQGAVEDFAVENGDDVQVRSFEDAGLLTRNKGLVVRVGDRVFQVSVVQA